jgi:hypothetical protein
MIAGESLCLCGACGVSHRSQNPLVGCGTGCCVQHLEAFIQMSLSRRPLKKDGLPDLKVSPVSGLLTFLDSSARAAEPPSHLGLLVGQHLDADRLTGK